VIQSTEGASAVSLAGMALQATDPVPSSPSKREALEVHTELTTVLREHLGGWPDAEALWKVERLCFRLRGSQNAALSEKAESIQQNASVLYSERKHSKYDGGAQAVRAFVWNDMASLWLIIDRME
jgi:hypothetical protein